MNFLVNLYASSAYPSAPSEDAAREIGPGFLGFIFTAFLVVCVIFLIKDMTRRIRRVRYEAEATTRQRELVERGERERAESGLYDGVDSRPAAGSGQARPGTADPVADGADDSAEGPEGTDSKNNNLWG
ncbi:hypothetical protein HD598_000067 [Neomicrococcus aestuarii]|uniref:Uncharacterized protein n=1 Tax=Neomicrococcus aestuarii TaxID=556325 RepID=A0A7W8TR64_9MICC|nr:hypothetical protein [Neomicrococcus aestuarii]MBB5511380.1 hypothetical protein [Neomicrococcus aestuarii]